MLVLPEVRLGAEAPSQVLGVLPAFAPTTVGLALVHGHTPGQGLQQAYAHRLFRLHMKSGQFGY